MRADSFGSALFFAVGTAKPITPFKGDVPDEIWEPFDAAISADTV